MQALREALRKAAQQAGTGAGGSAPGGGELGKKVGAALGTLIVTSAVVGGIGYAGYHSLVTVQPGHVGIIYNRFNGIDEISKCTEGMNVFIPWFQRPIIYDVRTRPKLINSQSGSKDLQMVQISLRVLFKPNSNNLPLMYRMLGKDYDERVLPSIVNEITKAVVAQYNASELLTKRDEVSRQIREKLLKRAADFCIIVDDVSITHLAFSKEYTAAVEAKQVAQQDAERAKYIVERAIQEKRRIVIRAEGEAQSAELIGKAVNENPAFIQLRRIDTAKEIANTVAGAANKVYLSADTLQLNQLGEITETRPVKKAFRLCVLLGGATVATTVMTPLQDFIKHESYRLNTVQYNTSHLHKLGFALATVGNSTVVTMLSTRTKLCTAGRQKVSDVDEDMHDLFTSPYREKDDVDDDAGRTQAHWNDDYLGEINEPQSDDFSGGILFLRTNTTSLASHTEGTEADASMMTRHRRTSASTSQHWQQGNIFLNLPLDFIVTNPPVLDELIRSPGAYFTESFGVSIAMQPQYSDTSMEQDGAVVAVGAECHHTSGSLQMLCDGAVYIYSNTNTKSSSDWIYQQKISPPFEPTLHGNTSQFFGCSVGMAHNYLVIGARGQFGAAYIYHFNNNRHRWQRQQSLYAPITINNITHNSMHSNFGASVAIDVIDNSTSRTVLVAIGADTDTITDNHHKTIHEGGAVYVDSHSSTSNHKHWTREAVILMPHWNTFASKFFQQSSTNNSMSTSHSHFGNALGIQESKLYIGAYLALTIATHQTSTPQRTGAVYVYQRFLQQRSIEWRLVNVLLPHIALYTINPSPMHFGYMVATAKEGILVIGAPHSSLGHISKPCQDHDTSGSAYVYRQTDKNNSVFDLMHILVPNIEECTNSTSVDQYTNFGKSAVIANDNSILIGAENWEQKGAVFVYSNATARDFEEYTREYSWYERFASFAFVCVVGSVLILSNVSVGTCCIGTKRSMRSIATSFIVRKQSLSDGLTSLFRKSPTICSKLYDSLPNEEISPLNEESMEQVNSLDDSSINSNMKILSRHQSLWGSKPITKPLPLPKLASSSLSNTRRKYKFQLLETIEETHDQDIDQDTEEQCSSSSEKGSCSSIGSRSEYSQYTDAVSSASDTTQTYHHTNDTDEVNNHISSDDGTPYIIV